MNDVGDQRQSAAMQMSLGNPVTLLVLVAVGIFFALQQIQVMKIQKDLRDVNNRLDSQERLRQVDQENEALRRNLLQDQLKEMETKIDQALKK